MTRNLLSKYTVASLGMLMSVSVAAADTLTIGCTDRSTGEAITLAYDGGDSGILKLAAPYGSADLPATKRSATNNVDGAALLITGVNARGTATLRMPSKSELEKCIVERRIPGEPPDRDIDFMSSLACGSNLSAVEPAIEVTVDVEFALIDNELQELVLKRIYPGTSEVTGDSLQLVAMPSGVFECSMKK
jgi:hypothetical protein